MLVLLFFFCRIETLTSFYTSCPVFPAGWSLSSSVMADSPTSSCVDLATGYNMDWPHMYDNRLDTLYDIEDDEKCQDKCRDMVECMFSID